MLNVGDDWIVCIGDNGRLPTKEDCKRYDEIRKEHLGSFLVTTHTGGNCRTTLQACYRIGEEKSFWFRDGRDFTEWDHVIAWQALPEPFRGEIKTEQ